MRCLVVALVILAAVIAAVGLVVGLFVPPVHAADAGRVASESVIRVMPAGHTFRDGDPIRICGMARTDVVVPGTVTLTIEQRNPDSRRRRWHPVVRLVQPANTMSCLMAVLHDAGRADLRVRTWRSSAVDWSVSRVVRVTVTP